MVQVHVPALEKVDESGDPVLWVGRRLEGVVFKEPGTGVAVVEGDLDRHGVFVKTGLFEVRLVLISLLVLSRFPACCRVIASDLLLVPNFLDVALPLERG